MYEAVNSLNSQQQQPQQQPQQQVYSELGHGGGRVGPREDPANSTYASVKTDEEGFPAVGNQQQAESNTVRHGNFGPFTKPTYTDDDYL